METKPLKTSPDAGTSRFQIVLCFLGLLVMNLVVALDSTALAVAFPVIAKDINASFNSIYYTGTIFLLTSCVFQPVFASLAALGRKFAILLALSTFMLGIILCAVAKTVWLLILGRAIQGAGAGGTIAMTYVLMADMFTIRERAKFVSLISLMFMIGTVSGPLAGGGFADTIGWRWIFWSQIPLTALALILIPIFTKTVELPGTKREILANIDWVGMVGFTLGVTMLIMMLSASGVSWPWGDWKTITGISTGFAMLAFTFGFSYRWHKTTKPMIPLLVVKNVTASINFVSLFFQGLLQGAFVYYLPLYFQTARPYSPLMAGILFLPQSASTTAIAIATGILIARTHCIKPYSLLGWAIMTIGNIPLAMGLLDDTIPVRGWILGNIPHALAAGLLIVSSTIATQASAEARSDCSPADKMRVRAMAAALNPFFRALGQAVGVVVGETTVENRLRKILGNDAEDVLQVIASLREPGSAEQKKKLVLAIISSLNTLWIVLTVMSALNLVLMLFTKDCEFRVPPGPSKDGEKEADKDKVDEPLEDVVSSASFERDVRRLSLLSHVHGAQVSTSPVPPVPAPWQREGRQRDGRYIGQPNLL
ncbi:MFS general substrate transporter [Microthyrium microscopicum]|uniref:MFS general substrate transporter n=1 Tax=Microthyrium microscopicum TaxID=703497 RepID=A0A6A6TYM0_9PEZI|nr:MFS general substrate transporter [Microthyrium microscopicum]